MSFNCDGVASRVALARLRMPRQSNVRSWHFADIDADFEHVRSWGVKRTWPVRALTSAFDP